MRHRHLALWLGAIILSLVGFLGLDSSYITAAQGEVDSDPGIPTSATQDQYLHILVVDDVRSPPIVSW